MTPARRTSLLSLLFLLLLACVAVAPGWRPGHLLGTSDSLLQFAPWSDNLEYHPSNGLLLDQPQQFLPWTYYAVHRMREAGHWVAPLWNPYAAGGQPFLANGQSAIFFPTFYLHVFLPPTWSWTLAAVLKLWFAGIGAWLLAGFYGMRPSSRLLVASCFMLCGFNIVWLNHPHSNVSIFLPWAILLTEKIIARPSLGRVAGLSAIIALQFLGGHPASSIHLLFICGLIFIARLLWLDRHRFGSILKAAPALLISIALGFAIAGVQWLPLLEYVHNSGAAEVRKISLAHHETIPHREGHIDYAQFIATWGELAGIVYPYANGYPPDGQTPYIISAATKLPDTNELAQGWCGLLTVMLAGLAIATRRREKNAKLFIALAILTAAIAVEFPGLEWIVRKIPGLSVAQNGRLLLATGLMLSLLAGFGLESLLDRLASGDPMKRFARTLMVLALLAVVVSLTSAGALTRLRTRMIAHARAVIDNAQQQTEAIDKAKGKSHEYPIQHWYHEADMIHAELVRTCLRLLIPAAFLAAAAFLLLAHRRRFEFAGSPAPWIGLIVCDLLLFAIPYNPASPIDTYFAKDVPAIDFLQTRLAGQDFRFAATYRSFIPETSTAYHLLDVRGYDAVGPYRRWLWKINLDPGDTFDEYLSRVNHPNLPSWQLMAMRYLLTAPGQLDPGGPWKQIYPAPGQREDAIIYENSKTMPRAWVVRSVRKMADAQAVFDDLSTLDDGTVTFDPSTVALVDDQGVPTLPTGLWQHAATADTTPMVRITQSSEEHVNVQIANSNGGWLILADNYFPGWVATVNNNRNPIVPAFGTLRAVPVPAGVVDVVFDYQPMGWKWGVRATAAGLACWLLMLIASLVRRPKAQRLGGGDRDDFSLN